MSKLILKVLKLLNNCLIFVVCTSVSLSLLILKDKILRTTSVILQFRNVQNVCFAVFARPTRHESCDLTSKSQPQIRLALSQGRICWLDRNICGHCRMPQQPFKVVFSLSLSLSLSPLLLLLLLLPFFLSLLVSFPICLLSTHDHLLLFEIALIQSIFPSTIFTQQFSKECH